MNATKTTAAPVVKPQPAPDFYRFCEHCGKETGQRLVVETATQEGYRCDGCGAVRLYTVR